MRSLLLMLIVSLVACSSNPAPAPVIDSTATRSCGPPYPIDPDTWERLQQPYEMLGQWYYPIHDPTGFVEEGVAVWYGDPFDGRPTASGEIFDKTKMTAAHPALPMNTCVRVTNLANGYWVILRINDRGPFNDMRVIDVSEAAAQYLGFLKQGKARVRIEVVP